MPVFSRSEPRATVLLGVPFHDVTMAETIDRIDALIARRTPCYLATANLDFAAQAERDVELQRILLEAELVLCDGTPLVWASRWAGTPLRERVAGSDLALPLLRRAVRERHRVFLLGASPEVLARLEAAAESLFGGNPFVGSYAPPIARLMDQDHAEAVRRIREAAPDLLIVAMGCPKQEKWISMHYRSLGVPVSIGLGATLDFLAGAFRRAPRWMQVCGAEWIFRLLQEPRRLVGRYAADLSFFARALRRQARLPRVTGEPGVKQEEVAEGRRWILWRGRLDAAALERGEGKTDLPHRSEVVVLEASGLTGVDAYGLGWLATMWRHCHEAGGSFTVLRAGLELRQALALSGLGQVISMEDAECDLPAAGGPQITQQVAPVEDAPTVTIWLHGELTAATVEEQEQALTRAWAARPEACELKLGLANVRFMDSSGLGLLLKLARIARERPQGRLALLEPSSNVRNVIHLAKLGPVLGIQTP